MNKGSFNRRQILIAGSTVLAAPAILTARAAVPDVVIGAIYPLSGSSAQIGVDAKWAFETALDIINNAHDLDLITAKAAGLAGLGGAKVKILYADHQADPEKGRAEAERLITENKVCALIGAYHSAVAATVSATAERYGVPFIAADSSSPDLSRRGLKYFFRTGPHDEIFTKGMFDFMDQQKAKGAKIETISLFYEDTIFGSGSAKVQRKMAAERGYKIVADVKYQAKSPSLTAEVQQLKTANADVLMPSSYTDDAILLVKTMDELGYKPKNIMAQAAGFSEKAVFDAEGDKLNGLISRASFSLDMAAKRKSIGVVNDMFKARAKFDLNDNTSRQFMAALVLADAIDRAKSTQGDKIRAALVATDIPGAETIMPWRDVKFASTGQNRDADPVLLQYQAGKFATIYPADVAVAAAKWPMNG